MAARLIDPSEENARKAAEEVAAYEAKPAQFQSDLSLLKWMVGTLIVLVLSVLGTVVTL